MAQLQNAPLLEPKVAPRNCKIGILLDLATSTGEYLRNSKMVIPDYQTIMLSLLKYSGDDEEHCVRQTVES